MLLITDLPLRLVVGKEECMYSFLQDVSDLFGSDLPVEGGKGMNFAWRDGPFLKALKNRDWILLDEVSDSLLVVAHFRISFGEGL